LQITALTLVNRLMRRHRYDDVSTFTTPEAKLALDLVNTSIRDLLAERDYPWNVRHDGELALRGGISGTNFTVITGATPFQDSSISGLAAMSPLAGRVVTRVVIGESGNPADYSATAVRVSDVLVGVGSLSGNLANNWPFTSVVLRASHFVIYEYVLPDDVAKVVEVRHEETPIKLLQIDQTQGFDDVFPRHWERSGDDPQMVAVGGMSVGTFDNVTADEGVRGLRMMVWPVPSKTMLLSYSYKERVAELVATTDALYAPDEFADDVVNRAEMYSNANAMGNDPDLAALQLRVAASNAAMKYGNSRLDPNRRHVVGAHDSGAGRRRDTTKYKDVTGL
jgi:hypothetical protein